MKADLSTQPTRFRSKIAKGVDKPAAIDPTGGDFGAGLIPSVAVITRGEALGHDLWIDAEFLNQTAAAINATGVTGAKARFTHPDMSGDGLGSMLGRVKNAKVDGDIVRGDLHLLESAKQTPDGDLASYVVKLAQEAPDAFGESIAFSRDRDAEARFMLDNGAKLEGRYLYTDEFKSPDETNSKNYPHARLAALHAIDTVDEPAANPSGLFSRTAIPAEADALLSYALGLSKERPTLTAFDVDPDRAAGFVARWMDRHGLSLSQLDKLAERTTEPTMPAETAPAPAPSESELFTKFQERLAQFTAKFGTENGTKWFSEGKTFEQGLELHCHSLTERLSVKDKEIDALNQQLAAAKLGRQGEKPVETNPAKQDGEKKPGLGIKRPGASLN